MENTAIVLKREISATRIPLGESLTLPQGTPVIITQALGGSFTVVVPGGAGLYRIDAEFADALGKEPVAASPDTGSFSEEQVWEALKTCYDPEIPVNIVDLGLVYSLKVEHTDKGANIAVEMTLTAADCGMGPTIAGDAKQKIMRIPGVSDVDVQVVWEPAWTHDRITEVGRKKLGMV
jgi:probable FeS assembly SUF system protein SufT